MPFLDREFFHNQNVTSVVQLNNRIITVSNNDSVKVWDINEPNRKKFIQAIHVYVKWVAKLDDNTILVGLTEQPFLAIYNVTTGEPLPGTGDTGGDVVDLGPMIATNQYTGAQDWPAVVTGLITFVAKFGGSDVVTCIAEYDNNTLVGGTDRGEIFMWSKISPLTNFASFVADDSSLVAFVAHLEINGDHQIVSRLNNNVLLVSNVTATDMTGAHTLTQNTTRRVEDVSSVAVLDDHTIVEGSTKGEVKVYDFNTQSYTRIFRAHLPSQKVRCIAVLNDSRIVTGSDDRTARVWHNKDGDGDGGNDGNNGNP